MFKIRRVYDDVTPADARAISEAKEILRTQFRGLARRDINKLARVLRNPLKHRFRAILFVAEDSRNHVRGIALLLHEPVLKFCFLEYLSTARKNVGGGIGGALYERVRQETLDLNTTGIFFECLPDSPRLSRNPAIRKQNRARLRFYERYGARPIINTAYETPVKPGSDNPPYLCYDNLGQDTELSRDTAQTIVREILERKYARVVTPEYIEMVVDSFKDDPVRIREPKYIKKPPISPRRYVPSDKRIILVVNDRHAIHHVEERGYVESPARIDSILKELNETRLFQKVVPTRFAEKYIRAVHDKGFVDYFKNVCARLKAGQSIYPYVFPIRNKARPPKDLAIRAGYYCIDTFTPINRNAYLAARRAADCTLTATKHILKGYRIAYALVRPPGHHAERCSFGGFCYFNSAAIAADYLSRTGKVAILDIDHHHGNGQQDIFYERADVLTISIHGNPRFAYPYFSGFAEEKGAGEGKGYNLNIPLPEKTDIHGYKKALAEALKRITRFKPRFLIVALGLDTAKEDPTGTWSLEAKDFETIGKMIGSLRFPSLIVQEGGYDTRVIGVNARHFFTGFWSGVYST